MPIFSSTIENLVPSKAPQPYYRFDGLNDSITLTAGHNSNVGSFEVWFLHEADTGSGTYQFIFTDANSNFELAYTPASSGTLTFYVANSGLGWSGYERDDKWHHVVGTFDVSGNSKKLYFDGDLVANTTCSTGTNGSNQYLGSRGGSYPWCGQISSFRYFNNALTATEVKELYSGKSVPFWLKESNQTVLNTGTAANTSFAGFSNASATTFSATDDAVSTASVAIQLTGTIKKGEAYVLTMNHSTFTGVSGVYAKIMEVTYGGNTYLSMYGDWFTSGKVTHVGRAIANSISNPYLVIYYTTTASTNIVVSDIKLTRAGAIAEYDGSGIASDKWFDKSGNDLHGTVSGATVENAPSGDDGLVYEEGTWTPDFYGSTGGSHTYGSEGRYTRIGNQVTCRFDKASFTWTTGFSGNLFVRGLPFTGEANANHLSCATDAYYYPGSTWQSTDECGILFLKNSADASLYCRIRDVGGDSDTAFPASRLNGEANQFFGFMFTYHV
mgnify:CR=1 FL=1